MSYATPTNALDQLGTPELVALTDRDNLGVVDTAIFQAALDRASDEIDIYLAARYATPMAVVPGLIVTCCIDIARYRLSGAEVSETDPVRTRFKDAIRFLESVRDGKTKLGAEVAVATSDSAQNLVYTTATDESRVFSRDKR